MKSGILVCLAAAVLCAQPAPPKVWPRPASIANSVEPDYSEAARNAGLQGTATVFVEIGANGAVKRAKILQGLGLGLDEKAVEAVKRFTFNAATEDGQPTSSELTVEVPFHLSGVMWRIERAAYRIEPMAGKRFTDLVKPKLKEYVAPDAKVCQGASGVASLEFDVGPDGVPASVHDFDPAHNEPVNAEIDSAAISSVQGWRFQPGRLAGAADTWRAHVELACGPAVPPQTAVSRVGNGVAKPELVYKVEPQYSEAARATKLSGNVALYLVVDPSGHATHVSVLRGLGSGLNENAVEAVLQWRFRPGTKEGKPVAVVANVQVNFRLL